MERRRRDRLLGGKKSVAAPLVALYAVVVFTASPEWVAWQGPLVVGSTDEEHRSPGRGRIAARFGARPAAPSPAECVMGPGQRNAAQESVKDPTSWASRFLPVERFLTIIM